MRPKTTATRCLHGLALILSMSLHVSAQEYTVTVNSPRSTALKGSQPGSLVQQLRYMIPLSFDPRQIDDILLRKPQAISVAFPSVLPFQGAITLTAFDVFTPEAKSYTGDLAGDHENSFRRQWASFRGRLPGDNQSTVVMNFSRSGADAMILMNKETYFIRSAGDSSDAAGWPHVFYAAAAVKQQVPFRCGVVDGGASGDVEAIIRQLESQRAAVPQALPAPGVQSSIPHNPPHVANPFGAAISTDTIEVRVALEGDYELFLAMGSEQAALNLMTSTVSYASAVYLNQATVKLTVPFIRVWTTTNNPYGHADLFASLDGFVSYWTQNMNNVDRTVAHMFTNSARWTTISGYVGIAKLNSLCSNLIGYGVTEVRQPSGDGHLMTFTHELGHNFGAHHTHSCFWPNGPLDYCAPIEEGNCYTGPIVQSTGTIMSYCSTRTFDFGTVVAGLIRRTAEFAACAPSVNRVPIAQADSTTLNTLYSSTNGSAWRTNTNWLSGSVARRYGITVRGGQVISIDLSANNLSGSFPSSLTNLTGLRVLNLSGRNNYHAPSVVPPDPATDRANANSITGQIPATIGQLTALEELDLSNNGLTGAFPQGITNLQQLHVLNLSENAITGTIPSTIGSLTNLETLDLWRTNMSGQIPTSIGSLKLLRVLVLSEVYGSADNQFVRLNGTLPLEMGNLSRLSVLDLSNNALSGQIPSQFGNLTSLTFLNLGQNKLSGPIPNTFSNLMGLISMTLNDNQLSGTLPSYIGSFTNLSSISVANNRMSGSIPTELGRLTNLLGLYLSNNAFSGTIPSSLGGLTALLDFDIHGNALTGKIPDSLRFLGTSAPKDFGGLLIFRVGDNKLTGPVPSWLASMTTITQLDLGGNQLDAQNIPIPDWVFARTSLTLLHLHDMKYTGTIPTKIFQFGSLNSLKLSGNQLTGTIPSQIGNMSGLNVLWLSDNAFTGTIPTELGSITSLTDLRLSNNKLSGNIPTSLGNLGGQVQYLYLNGNQLTGGVPAGFENFGSLLQLALNDNELDSIPRLSRLFHVLRDSSGFLAVQNNRLSFNSLAPMMQVNAQLPFINYTYIPQKPFGTSQLLTLAAGASTTITTPSDDPSNTYQWSRNGVNIAGATKASYAIASVAVADTGQYVVTVKNSWVPLLTLQGQPTTIRITYSTKPDAITLATPVDGATGVSTNAILTWNPSVQAAFYRVQLAKDSGFASLTVDSMVSSSSISLRSLSTSTKHYWHVSAGNTVGTSAYQKAWSFTTSATVSGIADAGGELPREYRLEQNFPNPFNPSTRIQFAVPKQGRVRLDVFTILGQRIATLIDNELSAGSYNVQWEAAGYPSGMYLYRMKAGTFTQTKKLFLLK